VTHPRKLVQAKVETSAALGPVTNEDSGMEKSRFTEEQIVYALKQAELGKAVGEICRKMGIAEATFYVWRKKYGGLGPSELKRLRLLEEESRKLS
jgi:putative transposase